MEWLVTLLAILLLIAGLYFGYQYAKRKFYFPLADADDMKIKNIPKGEFNVFTFYPMPHYYGKFIFHIGHKTKKWNAWLRLKISKIIIKEGTNSLYIGWAKKSGLYSELIISRKRLEKYAPGILEKIQPDQGYLEFS